MMENYYQTDPEFAERFEHFAFDEVVNEPGQQLDQVTRHMAISGHPAGLPGHRMPSAGAAPPPWTPG